MPSTAPSVSTCIPDCQDVCSSLTSFVPVDSGSGSPLQVHTGVCTRRRIKTWPRGLTHLLFLLFACFLENDTDTMNPIKASNLKSSISFSKSQFTQPWTLSCSEDFSLKRHFRHLDLNFHVVKMMMISFKIIILIDQINEILGLTSTTTTTKLVWWLGWVCSFRMS